MRPKKKRIFEWCANPAPTGRHTMRFPRLRVLRVLIVWGILIFSAGKFSPALREELSAEPSCAEGLADLTVQPARAVFFASPGDYCLPPVIAVRTIEPEHLVEFFSGNIFVILPACPERRVHVEPGLLRLRCGGPHTREAEISRRLVSSFSSEVLSRLGPTVPIALHSDPEIRIEFEILPASRPVSGPVVRIDRIRGLRIEQTGQVRSGRLARLLDPNAHRILLAPEAMFFGVLGSATRQSFTYHTYTSSVDLKRRGIRAALEMPNLELRRRLRPFVSTFADFRPGPRPSAR